MTYLDKDKTTWKQQKGWKKLGTWNQNNMIFYGNQHPLLKNEDGEHLWEIIVIDKLSQDVIYQQNSKPIKEINLNFLMKLLEAKEVIMKGLENNDKPKI